MFRNDTTTLENIDNYETLENVDFQDNSTFQEFLQNLETIVEGTPVDDEELGQQTRDIDIMLDQVEDDTTFHYLREATSWANLYNSHLQDNKGIGHNILATKPHLEEKAKDFLKYIKNTYTQ